MDLEPALDVIFKCLRALQYLHANGVIHRDIKPENVFVGDGTDVKLGDFGAATVAGLTHSQAVMMGSPFYMSPQRLEGAEADMQSDIFALGVLFYQLLTGKRTFRQQFDSRAGLSDAKRVAAGCIRAAPRCAVRHRYDHLPRAGARACGALPKLGCIRR